MKSKLFIYSVPAMLFVVLLYGFSIQARPKIINDSPVKGFVQQNSENNSVNLPSVEGACTYTWSAQTSGTTSQLISVSAVSSQIGWAAGVAGTVRRTINGGTTWTSASGTGITGGDIYNIYALDADIAFCTTSPPAGAVTNTNLFRTINGGATWTSVFFQAGGFLNGIQMISPTVGFAEGDPVGGKWTILKTIDGGATWTRIATEPNQIGGEFGYNNSFMILGSDIWFGTGEGTVYHSPDLGSTWSFAPTTLSTVDVTELHFNSGGASGLGLVSDGLSINKTVDGGASYTTTGVPGIASAVGGLEGDGNEWWAVRFDSVYYSVNQGATWTFVYRQGSASSFLDIDFAIESGCPVGWTVGNLGNIAKMSPPFTKTLQLTALIEGFVSCSPTFSNIGDTLTVQIRSGTSPYPVLDVAKGKTDANGDVTVSFTAALADNTPYYIVIRHRNSIETWSNPIMFGTGVTTVSYDFTTAASQAFGNNLFLKCGVYTIFGGDANQDGVVTLPDIILIANNSTNFVNGYVVTDVNGDLVTNLQDILIAFNNNVKFVTKMVPM